MDASVFIRSSEEATNTNPISTHIYTQVFLFLGTFSNQA